MPAHSVDPEILIRGAGEEKFVSGGPQQDATLRIDDAVSRKQSRSLPHLGVLQVIAFLSVRFRDWFESGANARELRVVDHGLDVDPPSVPSISFRQPRRQNTDFASEVVERE